MNDLTILIPAKNEAGSLGHVINEIENLNLNYFIIVGKDDLSTIKIIKKKENIIYQNNRGFGDAIISGISQLKTKYFALMFADGSTNPAELKPLLDHLQNTRADFVFGSRYLKNASSEDDTVITFIGNKIFTLIGKLFFNLKITDILYTYVIGKTDHLKTLNLNSEDFAICVELPIKAKKKGYKIVDFPCNERRRITGKKNVNALIDGSKILLKMIKMFFSR